MDFQKAWEEALKRTEIIRTRVSGLRTHQATQVPYIFLAESSINDGDTVVRKGEVMVDKPSLVLPPNNPMFKGFEFEQEGGELLNQNSFINFLLVRGITLPSLNYDNTTTVLEVYEGRLSEAIKHYKDLLASQENVKTGLLAGPEEHWQFSLLIFICSQITRNAEVDIKRLLEEYHKKGKDDVL